ncbi:flagellar hook-basal body protein [bacterium]|nr:flagellar hook-basal body protein [bacterium]
MFEGLYNSASGMINQARIQEIISTNIAKAVVPGHKKIVGISKPFEDALKSKLNGDINSQQVGGVEFIDNYVVFEQGPLKLTGNPLNFAIEGKGFFTVEMNGKEYYTRNGSFTMNTNGELVTSEGYPVLDTEGGRINILNSFKGNPADVSKITLSSDGIIKIHSANLKENIEAGKLKIVDFDDLTKLEPMGSSLFNAGKAVPQETEEFSLSQGYLEQSNVNIIDEMVSMISNMRIYETNQKILKSISDSINRSTNELGRV